MGAEFKATSVGVSESKEQHALAVLRARLLRAITSIDKKIQQQLDTILHHSAFQRLEASWRGLCYLAEQTEQHDRNGLCRIKVISLSWHELSRDINRAIDFDQSEFFKLIYSNEFDMAGGEPFGLLVGDYEVSHRQRAGEQLNDINVLKEIASTAAAAFAPFITSASPTLLGVDKFSELSSVSDVSTQFQQLDYLNWRRLRQMEESRFLGITLPRILMRRPYMRDGSRQEAFHYQECVASGEQDLLWGNAAFGFAAVLVRTFAECGWFSQIRGLQPGKQANGLVCELPCRVASEIVETGLGMNSVDLQVSDRLEKALSDSGLVPLSTVPYSPHLVFYSNASVQTPMAYDSPAATINSRLSSMLQYVMCVSRFAHYIKVMGRDLLGTYETSSTIESKLQRWLHSYTTASDNASNEVRAKYPLGEANIEVKEKLGQPGHYYSVIRLRPHFQLDQMVSSMRLVTELSPKFKTAV
ncbi:MULTISPECIES: type VI secretion system contractile sheath large subunit [Corallincola]|uniref:Type VI secretion system contractile sheath large subunit n=2 Tax=Corallincola TaxID=1775176 RepID=A0A368NQA8_9GAMM|nr:MULTISPECIES: type VI secretion system contractile sheath large subunit [Corallincola]RCU52732.1 type VI secretion system contractile sheath large subunit [Corallincola holothuriorum]TAA48086.1 type VI secretion system contractile sheath large subunit [Corallincola spongiicola]